MREYIRMIVISGTLRQKIVDRYLKMEAEGSSLFDFWIRLVGTGQSRQSRYSVEVLGKQDDPIVLTGQKVRTLSKILEINAKRFEAGNFDPIQ